MCVNEVMPNHTNANSLIEESTFYVNNGFIINYINVITNMYNGIAIIPIVNSFFNLKELSNVIKNTTDFLQNNYNIFYCLVCIIMYI